METGHVENTDTPLVFSLPGVNFRHFAGESDFPGMVAILAARFQAGKAERLSTLEDIRNQFANLANCDPARDYLFAESDGKMVGYASVTWELEEDTQDRVFFLTVNVFSDWEDKGLDGILLDWACAHAREIIAESPRPEQDKMDFFTMLSDQHQVALLELTGFSPVRYFFRMRRDLDTLPNDPLPKGIELLPITPRDYRALWDASVEAFKDEWGAVVPRESWYEEWLGHRYFQPLIWQIAWHQGKIVGMVLNYVDQLENEAYNRSRGYTESICVLREWRGKGVASALICRSLQMLKAMNMTEAALTVDTENPSGARGLYERLGFQPYRTLAAYRKILA